jgi:hypothetical protein
MNAVNSVQTLKEVEEAMGSASAYQDQAAGLEHALHQSKQSMGELEAQLSAAKDEHTELELRLEMLDGLEAARRLVVEESNTNELEIAAAAASTAAARIEAVQQQHAEELRKALQEVPALHAQLDRASAILQHRDAAITELQQQVQLLHVQPMESGMVMNESMTNSGICGNSSPASSGSSFNASFQSMASTPAALTPARRNAPVSMAMSPNSRFDDEFIQIAHGSGTSTPALSPSRTYPPSTLGSVGGSTPPSARSRIDAYTALAGTEYKSMQMHSPSRDRGSPAPPYPLASAPPTPNSPMVDEFFGVVHVAGSDDGRSEDSTGSAGGNTPLSRSMLEELAVDVEENSYIGMEEGGEPTTPLRNIGAGGRWDEDAIERVPFSPGSPRYSQLPDAIGTPAHPSTNATSISTSSNTNATSISTSSNTNTASTNTSTSVRVDAAVELYELRTTVAELMAARNLAIEQCAALRSELASSSTESEITATATATTTSALHARLSTALSDAAHLRNQLAELVDANASLNSVVAEIRDAAATATPAPTPTLTVATGSTGTSTEPFADSVSTGTATEPFADSVSTGTATEPFADSVSTGVGTSPVRPATGGTRTAPHVEEEVDEALTSGVAEGTSPAKLLSESVAVGTSPLRTCTVGTNAVAWATRASAGTGISPLRTSTAATSTASTTDTETKLTAALQDISAALELAEIKITELTTAQSQHVLERKAMEASHRTNMQSVLIQLDAKTNMQSALIELDAKKIAIETLTSQLAAMQLEKVSTPKLYLNPNPNPNNLLTYTPSPV